MKRFWFQLFLGLCIAASIIGNMFAAPGRLSVVAQAASTVTPVPVGGVTYVTNNYKEPVNVRSGPSSLYAQLGTLAIGDTARALGVSPKHEWIQIAFSPSPDGVGWVYASFVALSPGFLRVVEPPPTITPIATATIDPTLAAAFSVQPTETRLPTFTPPAPLVVPTFVNSTGALVGFPWGMTIILLGVAGVVVLTISFFVHR